LILYAIPTPLGAAAADSLPQSVLDTVRTLKDFAVENAKSARAFLKDAGCDVHALSIVEIHHESESLLKPLREGRPLGLLSGDRGSRRGDNRGGAPRRLPRRAAGRPLLDRARADGLGP
jgi:16S rRNA C1402 (ribose-2'-O) methylase RsmI